MTSTLPTHKSKHGFKTEGQNGRSKCRLTLWKASTGDKPIWDKRCKTPVLHGSFPCIIWYHDFAHLRIFKSSIPICLCILILHLVVERPTTDSQFMEWLSANMCFISLFRWSIPRIKFGVRKYAKTYSFYDVFKVMLCNFRIWRSFYCNMTYQYDHKTAACRQAAIQVMP